VATVTVDGVELTDLATLVAGDGRVDCKLRRQSPGQSVQHHRRQITIGQRLGADGADAGAHEGDEGARREGLGGDGSAEGTGRGIVGDDRPGHRFLMLI
jgi:hypothetical protein